MGFNERSLGIDHSFDNVDTNNARVQRIRVLLHCRFHHILPWMVEYMLGRPNFHFSRVWCFKIFFSRLEFGVSRERAFLIFNNNES